MDRAALDAALLRAHADDDHDSLVKLYTDAGNLMEAEGNIDAACFFLTQAYIFALEAGMPEAMDLNKRLAVHGRIDALTG